MGTGREFSISLDGVRDKNLMQLKKLNSVLFPFRYNDKYYTDALGSGEFTKLAYYSDICVGSIACRLEKKEGGIIRVYIMTLGVLAPYRGLGIGTKMLNHVLELCTKQNVGEIYLHVQTNNEDAINFYKKFGFKSQTPSRIITSTLLLRIAMFLRRSSLKLLPRNEVWRHFCEIHRYLLSKYETREYLSFGPVDLL